ncbi:MAG: MBOAT family protein, partial [Methyloversatilis sp.]|nr:MBOAT family protein [Methyloversatilis sp.]
MLFNSWEFLLGFLPLTFAGFFLLARVGRAIAAGWLFIASLAFYGWWEPIHVLLLLASIAFNFTVGSAISPAHAAGATARAKRLLWLGIATDL